MRRLALDELAAAERADELAVARLHFAAHGDDTGPALDLPAFERAVVEVACCCVFAEIVPR